MLLELSGDGGGDSGCHQLKQQGRSEPAPAPGAAWDAPLGTPLCQHWGSPGQEGRGPPCAQPCICTSRRGPGPINSQRHASARFHFCSCAQGNIQRPWGYGTVAVYGDRGAACPHPGTPPMGSDPLPQPHSSRPQEKPEWGLPPSPPFLPVRCRWQCQHPGTEQVSRAPHPPPRLFPCSLTRAGGLAAGSPRPLLLADGVGSQHRWPCAMADWGRLPATCPGRATSLP